MNIFGMKYNNTLMSILTKCNWFSTVTGVKSYITVQLFQYKLF